MFLLFHPAQPSAATLAYCLFFIQSFPFSSALLGRGFRTPKGRGVPRQPEPNGCWVTSICPGLNVAMFPPTEEIARPSLKAKPRQGAQTRQESFSWKILRQVFLRRSFLTQHPPKEALEFPTIWLSSKRAFFGLDIQPTSESLPPPPNTPSGMICSGGGEWLLRLPGVHSAW